jgi:uncharacterized protein YdhG (YjbR/CyaY superfamily)
MSRTDTTTDTFTAEERAAMKERAAELRARKGGRKKEADLNALLQKIEELPPGDREIAAAVHTLVTELAPELDGRTYYGMPAWAKDGNVLLFVQPASKFGTRYATLGFNDNAQLDDGEMWPTAYAVPAMTDGVREKVAALVRRAVGRD